MTPAPAAPPQGPCTLAPESEPDELLYEWAGVGMVCAGHYRELAEPYRYKRTQLCDRCGAGGAFRDPQHRKDEYLCPECHAADGYTLGDAGMLSKVSRVGKTHPLGRKLDCIAAGHGTECRGQVKQRAREGVLCDRHWDPVGYVKRKGA